MLNKNHGKPPNNIAVIINSLNASKGVIFFKPKICGIVMFQSRQNSNVTERNIIMKNTTDVKIIPGMPLKNIELKYPTSFF